MLDHYDRKIDYLRISITDRCNLRCTYCMPEEGIQMKSHREIISYENIIRLVKDAVEIGFRKVRLTGGEPLVRKGVVNLVKELASIEELEEVCMTTNGVLLKQFAKPLKEAGLSRINISLDTIDSEKYRTLTRTGTICDVMEGIDATIAAGFKDTKINMVVQGNFNADEVLDMKKFCDSKGLKLQRINHYSLSDHNTTSNYEAERPLPCHLCNRLRITADGRIKPCLFSDKEIPIDFDNIKESLLKAVEGKPQAGTSCTSKGNWQIGG